MYNIYIYNIYIYIYIYKAYIKHIQKIGKTKNTLL